METEVEDVLRAEAPLLPSALVPVPVPMPAHQQRQQPLAGEGWYHGRLSRREAESRLAHSGDFLVRESFSAPGQYVLSGLQGDTAKHLLLMDPEGTVGRPPRRHLFTTHDTACHPCCHLALSE